MTLVFSAMSVYLPDRDGDVTGFNESCTDRDGDVTGTVDDGMVVEEKLVVGEVLAREVFEPEVTPDGVELVDDAEAVVDDVMNVVDCVIVVELTI